MIWKRLAVLSVLLFGFCCFPVMAEESTDWPDMDTSSSYDYSKLVINPDSFKDATYNLTRSLKSYSNIGYQIMFILGGVMLIPKIFKMFTAHAEQVRKGVDRRSLNREIEAMDFDENRTEVINSKLLEKEINLMSEQRFRAKNWESLVENGKHKRELSRDIETADNEDNHDAVIRHSVSKKAIALEAKQQFRTENMDALVEDGVAQRTLSRQIEAADKERNYDDIVADGIQRGLENRALNRGVQAVDFDENRKEVLDAGALQRKIGLFSEQQFREEHWDILVQEGVHKRELAREVYRVDVEYNLDAMLADTALHQAVTYEATAYRKANAAYYKRRTMREQDI